MTITIPDSQAGLADFLSDPDQAKELWKDGPKGLTDFIQGYADKHAQADQGDVSKQVAEQVQLGLANYLKEHGSEERPPVDFTGQHRAALAPHIQGMQGARSSVYNKRAPGVAADGVFEDRAEFFRATWHRADRLKDFGTLRPKLARLGEIQNAYGSEVPADGGFLIPEILRSEILQMALETAVVRPRATVIPMSSLRVPIPTIDDTSHVSSVMGGVTAYWTEEGAALTQSSASFARTVLDAKKLTAYSEVPNELLQDAPAFAGFFDSSMPRAVTYFEDVAWFTGTGVAEPLGYLNSPCSIQVAAEAGQPTQTIVWENIVKMYARMLPTSLGSAVWVVSPDTFPQLATMALSVGTGGGPIWIGGNWGGGGQSGSDTPPARILGRPVVVSEKAPTLGTTGDIAFVDLSYYLIGDRMAMQSTSSEHYKFANDMTAFRIIERVDGRPWLNSALTPHNGGPTLSPIVQLATR